MTAFDHAAISPAGDGQPNTALGRRIIRIPASATGGSLSIWDEFCGPGEGAPPHLHMAQDEFFQVVQGQFRIWCGDEQFDVGPGSCMVLPRGVAHRFQNIGKAEGHLTVVMTPGGFEDFFLEIEQDRVEAIEAIETIGRRHGLSLLLGR